MMKNKGTAAQVIQMFWANKRLCSDYFTVATNYGSRSGPHALVTGTRPWKKMPDIVNTKILPLGIDIPHRAVTKARSLSGNHLLQIKLIAAKYIG